MHILNYLKANLKSYQIGAVIVTGIEVTMLATEVKIKPPLVTCTYKQEKKNNLAPTGHAANVGFCPAVWT